MKKPHKTNPNTTTSGPIYKLKGFLWEFPNDYSEWGNLEGRLMHCIAISYRDKLFWSITMNLILILYIFFNH